MKFETKFIVAVSITKVFIKIKKERNGYKYRSFKIDTKNSLVVRGYSLNIPCEKVNVWVIY